MKQREYTNLLTELTKVTLHSLIISHYGFQNNGKQPIPRPEDIAEDAVELARHTIRSLDNSAQTFKKA